MEYGNFKPYEAKAFELEDHVMAYKQSSKFKSRNVLMEVNLENFLPRKLLAIRYLHGYMVCSWKIRESWKPDLHKNF